MTKELYIKTTDEFMDSLVEQLRPHIAKEIRVIDCLPIIRDTSKCDDCIHVQGCEHCDDCFHDSDLEDNFKPKENT